MLTDAQAALAQVREALADPMLFDWARDWDRARAIRAFERSCTTANIAAILAHVETQAAEVKRLRAALQYEQHRADRQGTHGDGCADWGPAHYECAIRERDELRRQLAEAEQRFDWLATRLEDVQIDDADPNDHYHGDEEDVPYPVLWKRAIDTAMGASNE